MKILRSLGSIDYISDVHVDGRLVGDVPNLTHIKSPICIVPGDIGSPDHPNFDIFINNLSKSYEESYVVPGNHEFNSSSLYSEKNKKLWTPILHNVLEKYKNVHLIDDNLIHHAAGFDIVGCTLWSKIGSPKLNSRQLEHNEIHKKNVQFIENAFKNSRGKDVVVATHYVPSYRLIEEKYKNRYSIIQTSYFASDLDDLIPNAKAWFCGHTHSKLVKIFDSTYCGVNAVGNNLKSMRVVTWVPNE